MKLNINISYFEQLLDVTFVETTRGKYRAKEHSSYAISTAKDGTLLFCSYNGDYGDKHLNAYGLTKRIFPHLTPKEIWEKIGQRIEQKLEQVSNIELAQTTIEKQTTDIPTPKPIFFQEDDKALSVFRTFHYFQKKIGIKSLQDLKAYPIKTIKQYGKIHDARLKTPLFAYCEGDNIKVKDPQKKIFKSKVVLKTPIQNYVFGFDVLQKIPNDVAKKIYVVITEGEDDAFAINYHCQQVKAITFGGVTNALNSFIIEQLRHKFAGVLIGFDNDAAGIKNAPIQAQKHQLPYFICPTLIDKNQQAAKDFCDLLKVNKFNSIYFENIILGEIAKTRLAQQNTLKENDINSAIFKNFPLYICSREEALQLVKYDNHAVVFCETNYQDTARKIVDSKDIQIFDYQELYKLREMPYHIYFLGSQLLQRNAFQNVWQKLLELSAYHKVTLFADTDTNLPVVSEKFNRLNFQTEYKLLIDKNHDAAFLTLAQVMPDAKCLECGKSLMSLIDTSRIVWKADLGFADKKDTLLVYVNEDLHILPNEYQGYKEVIFVCNEQRYPSVITIKQIVDEQRLIAESIIRRLESNPQYYVERDIMAGFSHALIKPIFDKVQKRWIVSASALNALAYQKQCNMYAKDFLTLANDTDAIIISFDEFIAPFMPESQTVQAQIEVNAHTIKANALTFREEKKRDFKALALELKPHATTLTDALGYAHQTTVKLIDENGNQQDISEKRVLKTGEKLFVNRLKTMCQHVAISIGFDLVANHFHNFNVALQRARVQQVLERPPGTCAYADRLNVFAHQFTTSWHQKEDIAATFITSDIGHADGDAWKQVKKAFFMRSKTMRINGKVTRVYQLVLLSD